MGFFLIYCLIKTGYLAVIEIDFGHSVWFLDSAENETETESYLDL